MVLTSISAVPVSPDASTTFAPTLGGLGGSRMGGHRVLGEGGAEAAADDSGKGRPDKPLTHRSRPEQRFSPAARNLHCRRKQDQHPERKPACQHWVLVDRC